MFYRILTRRPPKCALPTCCKPDPVRDSATREGELGRISMRRPISARDRKDALVGLKHLRAGGPARLCYDGVLISGRGETDPCWKPWISRWNRCRKRSARCRRDKLMEQLVVLQQQARQQGVGLVVLFEGWNGAGKGSRISDLMFNLDARATSVAVTEDLDIEAARTFAARTLRRDGLLSGHAEVLGGTRSAGQHQHSTIAAGTRPRRSTCSTPNSGTCPSTRYARSIRARTTPGRTSARRRDRRRSSPRAPR